MQQQLMTKGIHKLKENKKGYMGLFVVQKGNMKLM